MRFHLKEFFVFLEEIAFGPVQRNDDNVFIYLSYVSQFDRMVSDRFVKFVSVCDVIF